MKRMRRVLVALLSLGLLAGCASAGPAPNDPPRVLVLTHSTGYRHASIEPAAEAIRALGEAAGYVMEVSGDPDMLARLEGFDAIVLVSTSSDANDPALDWIIGARREGLQNFVHGGGGVVALHAASASHYSWPWYGAMIGGVFNGHPAGPTSGLVRIVDGEHPATRGLPEAEVRSDEWYYIARFDPSVRVLAVYDPLDIGQGELRPVSWAHEFEGGRVFYTALGHTDVNYQEDFLLRHIGGGLRWALRLED